jgi:hypothetical protein
MVSMFYNMLMLLNTEEEKYFFELLKVWDKFEDKLSVMDQYNIHVALNRYCLNRIQKGDIEYRKQQLDITKKILEKNLIPKEVGYIESYFFTSVVRNAAKLKEFSWAEDFITNYKERLDQETIGEIINYSLAIIEFEKGSYEKSLRYLSTINPERLNMKLNVKNLSIMNYYELNYTEELISLIDTYKHYLHRDKNITEQARQSNTVFIKFVSALVKVKLNEKNESVVQLRKEIESSPYFNLKDWVLEKIEELRK